MARLPDRFDLWVRKARACADTARQADYVLGALAGLREWHFFNAGTKERTQPAQGEVGGERYLLVFSDAGRIEELVCGEGAARSDQPPPVISIPTALVMAWCLEQGAAGCAGLLVNPGDEGVVIPMDQLKAFHEEWSRRGPGSSGFWIPNLTSEEEDFWQEHGL